MVEWIQAFAQTWYGTIAIGVVPLLFVVVLFYFATRECVSWHKKQEPRGRGFRAEQDK